MTAYVMPQALVYQEFTSVPEALVQPLLATIVGPNYQLVTTIAQGLLGEYDPATDTCYGWPGRETGAVVDQDWTRVFIDDALLQYFYTTAGGGDDITATYCSAPDIMGDYAIKNAIRADNLNWKTYGTEARDAVLLERDVQVGDVAKISAVVGSDIITLWTYVAGFINDKIDGIVHAAYEDPNNVDTAFETSSSSSPAISVTKIGFPASSVDVTGVVTPPNVPEQGFINGVQRDTYLLQVIEAGEPAAAVIRVTSASGKDDVSAVTPAAWGASTTFGTMGLGVTFTRGSSDAFEVGMAWELDVKFGAVDVDPVSGGAFDGPADSTYVITVSKGGTFGGGSGDPEITVTTTTGIDSSGPHVVSALESDIDIGSYGTTIRFHSSLGNGQGLYAGNRYYIPITAPASGAIKTLVLGHNLPSGLIGLDSHGACSGRPPYLAVTLYIKKDIEVEQDRTGYAPLLNWTTSATEVCLSSGVLSYDVSWINNSGTMLPLPVKAGSAWVMYRALRAASAAIVGTISDITSVQTILGTPVVDNPLAFGVYMALLNSGGQTVIYVGVPSDDIAGYTTALNKLTKRDDVYSLVVLTFDIAIQNLAAATVAAMSTPETGRWRRVICGMTLVEEQGIVTTVNGAAVLATILDDPSTGGMQYTLVEFTSVVDLVQTGVRPGDILRAVYTTDGFGNETYSEYPIDVVLSEDSLRLMSGPTAAVTLPSRVQIWRNLTETEQITATAVQAARFATRRVTSVWPDYFELNNVLTPGYFEACTYAGLRSTTVPQRSLTNIALLGIDSVKRTTDRYTEAQLNQLAAAGVCIISQNMAGEIYIRHNLTTDMSDVKHREESITANLDSISYVVLQAVAPYIGSSNLTDETINQIEVEIKDVLEYLHNNSNIPTVGGQLISGTVRSIAAHPTLADRLVVILDLVLPAPVNNIEVHLVV